MKKLMIILLLMISSTILNAQFFEGYKWEEVELPTQLQGKFFLEIYFLDSNPDYGWICGYSRDYLRTTDRGNTWLHEELPELLIDSTFENGKYIYDTLDLDFNNQFECIKFLDTLNGYVAGQDVLIKTTDGGDNWKQISNETFDLWGFDFWNKELGITAGGGCGGLKQFNRTTDGGHTWENYTTEGNSSGLTDVKFISHNHALASSSGEIWETLDSGKTWSKLSSTGEKDWQEDISVFGNTILVPYSPGCSGGLPGPGGVRISTNFGLDWNQDSLWTEFYGTYLINETTGWAVGTNLNEDFSSVYYTNNGGKYWYHAAFGIDSGGIRFDDVWFIDDTTGWIVGTGIYKFTGRMISSVDEEDSNSGITISPNPAIDYIEIKNLSPNHFSKERGVRVEIFDVLGRKHTPSRTTSGHPSREGIIRLNITYLQPGIYFVWVGDEFLKFVKL